MCLACGLWSRCKRCLSLASQFCIIVWCLVRCCYLRLDRVFSHASSVTLGVTMWVDQSICWSSILVRTEILDGLTFAQTFMVPRGSLLNALVIHRRVIVPPVEKKRKTQLMTRYLKVIERISVSLSLWGVLTLLLFREWTFLNLQWVIKRLRQTCSFVSLNITVFYALEDMSWCLQDIFKM